MSNDESSSAELPPGYFRTLGDGKLPAPSIRESVLGHAEDLMTDFLYYGRQEDEELPIGAIDKALATGVVTVDELLDVFRKHLESAREEPSDGDG